MARTNREALIDKLADDPRNEGLTKKQLAVTLQSVQDNILDSLQNVGDEVGLTGFGRFSVVIKAATTSRNPRTGEAIQVPARQQLKFKFATAEGKPVGSKAL